MGHDRGGRGKSGGRGSTPRPGKSWDRRPDRKATGATARSGGDGRHSGKPVAPRPRAAEKSKYEAVHISDDVVRELHRAVRPGKGEILVKVFSDALAAYVAGDLDEAMRLGDQAKHMALRSTNVRELLGLVYYAAGRWQEATRELSAFRRIAGSSEQNPVIGDSYRALGKPEKAVQLADEIDRAEVDAAVYFEGQIVAAGALADLRRLDEAIERLERLDLDPAVAQEHHMRAWYVLGDLLERKGRFSQARSWFEAVAAADPDYTDAPERIAKLTPKEG